MPSKTTLKKTVPNWYLTQAEWVEKAKDCGLVGHEHVIAELYYDYIAYMSGMHFKDSPITARVLAGPTGTGKTKLVQTLAYMLHGDPRKVLRIDCSEYQHSHDVAKLVGAPPGYLGHRETSPLLSMSALNNLRSERIDVSIVLFDEFEKAHDSLYRMLLGVLDYGRMSMGDNSGVLFNRTMVFFTTNIGVKARANSIGLQKTPPPESSKKTVLVELKKRFSAEFLNRLGGDSQIHYLELITRDQLKQIATLELEKLSGALYKALRIYIVSIDDKVFDFILDTSQASEYAGRGIEKVIDKVIKPAIIQYVIENRPVTPSVLEKTAVSLNYNEGLVVEAESYA